MSPAPAGAPAALARVLRSLSLVLAAAITAASVVKRRPAPTAAPARATAPAGAARTAPHEPDRAPGDEQEDGTEPGIGHVGYAVGLGLAVLLTAVSFGLVRTGLFWGPSIPIAISVLAVAQMGVHLVFFLHIGSGPDSANNILALAFGVLIVFLLITGSLWIMGHLNANMMPMDGSMSMPTTPSRH